MLMVLMSSLCSCSTEFRKRNKPISQANLGLIRVEIDQCRGLLREKECLRHLAERIDND